MPSTRRRALITGVAGQDGGYLAEQLLADDYQVFGLVRGEEGLGRARACPWLGGVELIPADMRDGVSLARALERSTPDEIYNLASHSVPGRSWSEPEASADVNALGPLRLLEHLREAGAREVRFCQASSSEMFGSDAPNPQDEDTQPTPRSPYGAAKAYAHHVTRQYRFTCGLFACTAIFYNHESPRRSEQFVTRKISRAVARIKLGRQRSIGLGSLSVQRDWGYTPDYVRAMRLMLRQEQPDDYVIGSGEAHTIGEFAEIAFARVGLDSRDFVEIEPELARHGNPVGLVANPTRARERLGWSPSVDFKSLVELMVDADLALESA